jgi:hypothetical protein
MKRKSAHPFKRSHRNPRGAKWVLHEGGEVYTPNKKLLRKAAREGFSGPSPYRVTISLGLLLGLFLMLFDFLK